MTILSLVYILTFIIFLLIVFAIIQLNSIGLNVKDFWSFIDANQKLDKLYTSAKKQQRLNVYEQLIFLKEAEKVFKAYDKVPNILWEEEYQKYTTVLEAYRDIRMLRWVTAQI